MANKIDKISPKIEIINHFDSLINRVDIDIEESLEKHNKEQVLSQLDCFDIGKRNVKRLKNFSLKCFDPSTQSSEKIFQYQTVNEWQESTKVVDYLNRVRQRTIDELTKAQEDNLEYLKLNPSNFKSNDHQLIDEKKMDEIRSEIFKEKFYFQVLYKPKDPKFVDPWIFNLFTFIADFYMSSTDIALLETYINSSQDNYGNDIELLSQDLKLVFNEKMVLIGLLQKKFFDNLKTQKFPSHVIIVRKEDILNIQQISCNYLKGVNLTSTTIDLSKLERLELSGDGEKIDPDIKIEGLCSLKILRLNFDSLGQVILSDLFELKHFCLHLFNKPVNSKVLFKFNDYLPNIEILELGWYISYFNLDSLSNLKSLRLYAMAQIYDFNFDLFNILCNQLEDIMISGPNIDNKFFDKLFNGRNFPYFSNLSICDTGIIKLEKDMFGGFRMLKELFIYFNKELRIIDHDSLSNLKHLDSLFIKKNFIESLDNRLFSNLVNLKRLDLSENQLEAIDENCFSSLQKLEFLNLSENKLTSLDPKSFVGLNNLKKLNLRSNKLTNFDLNILDNIRQIEEIGLSENPITNKEEILSLPVSSKIKFIL